MIYNKKFLIFTFIIFSLFTVSTVSAEEISSDNFTVESDVEELSINNDNPVLNYDENAISFSGEIGENNNVYEVDDNFKEIYFDASAAIDGDGSIDKPYNVFKPTRLTQNTIAHFANGEYVVPALKWVNNIVLIGEDSKKTIISSYTNGGFEVQPGKTFTIINLTLLNPIIINKGTFICENCILDNGTGTVNPYGNAFGGAVINYNSNSNIYISNTSFINNHAEYGGAIYNDGGIVDIENSYFINNTAYNYGGAIASDDNGNVKVTNTYFINSISKDDAGGAIYSKNNLLNIYNSYFINCSANFGSAICSLSSNTFIVSSEFRNNRAKYDGGALYQMYSALNISDSIFYNNSAVNGGAIFSDNLTLFEISLSNFTENVAINGKSLFINDVPQFVSIANQLTINETYSVLTFRTQIGDANYTIIKYIPSFNGDIPVKYNSAELGYVTSIKNQQEGGNCWSFATLAVLESNILKATNLTYDLSEENMKNMAALYSRFGFKLKTNGGGNDRMAIGYLTSWLGPINESDDKYDDLSTLSPFLNSLIHIQNVYYVPARTNPTDNDAVKEAIMKYGAVTSPIFFDSMYYDDSNAAYYYNGDFYANHEVAIVGWDDNYSRYNFPLTPEGDGAFIVKNSWGTDWGHNGYFYVSYYDTIFCKENTRDKIYTFIFNDTIRYNKNYQYDMPGITDHFTVNNTHVWVKNIFNSTGDDVLAAFSTYFYEATDFEAYIYVNGYLKTVKTGTINAGYYTIQLDKFIPLKKGDIFEVCLKLTSANEVTFAVCENVSITRMTYGKGVSFVSFDGNQWFDLENFTYSYGNSKFSSQVACIKAFTTGMINTNISLGNISYGVNMPVEITVNVTDEYGRLVDCGVVTFIIDGKEYNASVKEGKAILQYTFTSLGNFDISVKYVTNSYYNSSTAFSVISVEKSDVILIVNYNNTVYGEDIVFNISLVNYNNMPLNETLTVNFNKNIYKITLINGEYCFVVKDDLNAGKYDIIVEFEGNEYYNNQLLKTELDISKANVDLDVVFNRTNFGEDIIILISSNKTFDIPVTVTIDSEVYDVVVKNGSAKLSINTTLDRGEHVANITVSPSNNYNGFNKEIFFIVDNMRTVLISEDIIMYYKNGTRYEVILIDGNGNPLVNEKVNIIISGVSYVKSTDGEGKTSIAINLIPGTYSVTVRFNGSDVYQESEITNNITVLSTIGGKDVVMYFCNGTQYCATFLDGNGAPLANVDVRFNINGVFYKRTTDVNGVASLNIRLNPGNYIITAIHPNGQMFSNNIEVLPVLTGSDLNMKFDDGSKYGVKLVDGSGNPVSGVNITMNINGVFYNKLTDSEGIARLNIRLLPGEYIITSMYDRAVTSNKITIKS